MIEGTNGGLYRRNRIHIRPTKIMFNLPDTTVTTSNNHSSVPGGRGLGQPGDLGPGSRLSGQPGDPGDFSGQHGDPGEVGEGSGRRGEPGGTPRRRGEPGGGHRRRGEPGGGQRRRCEPGGGPGRRGEHGGGPGNVGPEGGTVQNDFDTSTSSDLGTNDASSPQYGTERPARIRRPPGWMVDYE